MRVLIVDDEPLARRRLRRLVENIDGVEVVAEAIDGVDATEKIAAYRPDLVFLDIHMPGQDGLSVAATSMAPAIVFTTAHAEHAVEAFELNAIDYLLKPIPLARLELSIERTRTRRAHLSDGAVRSVMNQAPEKLVRVTARINGTVHVFDPAEITRIRATDKYSVFLARGEEMILDESLNALEARLEGFLRVHRSELINVARVTKLVREDRALFAVLDDDQKVPVSRRLATRLRAQLA